MVEVFRHDGGIVLGGANVDGRVEVRRTSRLAEHYAPSNFDPAPLRKEHFTRMAQIAEGIRAIYTPGTPTNRKLGFHAWIRAVQERYGNERLHQFVRAIEAVIKPAEGQGKRHFKHRCQPLVR
jgi:hypothetical protein